MAGMNFAVGQKWTFRGETQDSGATVGIGRIIDDPFPKGAAIHVWVEGLGPESEKFKAISHTPMARDALERSVVALVEENVTPPASFDRDFEVWRTTEGAGIWTTTLDRVIATVRRAMSS
jgi:hypothetical protein